MVRVVLRRRWLRVAWLFALALTLTLLAAFARSALAASLLIFSHPGNPTTGTVQCYSTTLECLMYPQSSVGTPGWAYRNWADAWWAEGPSYTRGEVAYVNANGSWFATATADTPAKQLSGGIHLGQSGYAKVLCVNSTAFTATNTFMCSTTSPS